MTKRATRLIVCPRCGLGNSLRVMASAIRTARQHELTLAHLWRRDSPVGCPLRFEDEQTGARACDFETLFEPLAFFPPFVNDGRTVRLLYEEANPFAHEGLNVVEAREYPLAAYQFHGPLTEDHLAGVDDVLVLTSLSFPIHPAEKIELYQRHFIPRARYLAALEARGAWLEGLWMAVHLRTQVREAFGLPAWSLQDLVATTQRILAQASFDRIVVFSDSQDARREFARQDFGRVPVCTLDWEGVAPADRMFLDFLAISRASLVLGSGVSSFSYEASLLGGGVPYFDMCLGLLRPGVNADAPPAIPGP